MKILYSIFEKKDFLSEIRHKHRDRLNGESPNQIDVLLPIAHNCNDQIKIPTSLNFSWHESEVCNLILVKILHTIECLFEVLQLNTSNNTFHFDFSFVQAILKNLKLNLICLSHLLILKTVHTRILEGNNVPVWYDLREPPVPIIDMAIFDNIFSKPLSLISSPCLVSIHCSKCNLTKRQKCELEANFSGYLLWISFIRAKTGWSHTSDLDLSKQLFVW